MFTSSSSRAESEIIVYAFVIFCAAFRCAYCFFLNPARKTRPQAPRLPDFSCEKKQPTELQTAVGPLHSGGVKLQENPPKEGVY